MNRTEAITQAKDFAQVPRNSRGGQDIPIDELNPSSRGANWEQMKGNGATKLGSRNSRGPNYWVEHPDGHPDAGGLNIPNHHGGGHIHAKNAKGQTIVIPYNNPAVFKPLDLSAEKAVSTNKTR